MNRHERLTKALNELNDLELEILEASSVPCDAVTASHVMGANKLLNAYADAMRAAIEAAIQAAIDANNA